MKKLAAFPSIAILTFFSSVSALIFLYVQLSDARKAARPNIRWDYVAPGFEETYGFFIQNIGGGPMLITDVKHDIVSRKGTRNSQQLFDDLYPNKGQYRMLWPGPTFTLKAGERYFFYEIRKKLEPDQYDAFNAYISTYSGIIMYCDTNARHCETSNVNLQRTLP